MAFKWVKGRTVIREFPRTASTTFTKNSLVYFDSGSIVPADATSGDHYGICLQDVASTDANFATAAVQIAVEMPMDKNCVMLADVTGTLATTDVGLSFDLSTALVVNKGATAKKVVTCTRFISATQGLFELNASFDVFRVATT